MLYLHSYMLAEVAEVLLELVSWQKAHGVDWVRSAVQKLPRDRAAVATEQQCWQFHQYAVRSAPSPLYFVHLFVAVCSVLS